ncbi:hypothetical protein QWY84_10585 [Aquisalimonas lutea]|uniref:hypothetical protein n=1 Tax=Aquisalimonas lutea TaxID=1327750 RepID=UPI0025B41B9E|nr:hypothetical protein [Aquisalimonas lutea]MDN3518056.1 hypothetical protein [Aquisalimonas lutea]
MEEDNGITAWIRDLAVLARESVNAQRRVAEVMQDQPAADSLNRLAGEHEALVDELDSAIWNRGALTSMPDADLETLRDLRAHFETFVHLSEPEDLLRRCRETEAKLSAAAAEVTRITHAPADLVDIAARLEQEAEEASLEIDRLLQRM